MLVRDQQRRDLVYVCRPEAGELVVVTLWEEGEDAAVPKRFTDALRPDDDRVAARAGADRTIDRPPVNGQPVAIDD